MAFCVLPAFAKEKEEPKSIAKHNGIKEIHVEEKTDPSKLTLKRIFTDEDFKSKKFGPIRWLKDGSGYTTLEKNDGYEDAKDIVKNDPATGDSEVLLSASRLIPEGGKKPLEIKNYSWSDDNSKLLVYTNSVKV